MGKKRNTTIEGVFRQLIYGPKGSIEGVMILVDGEPAQLVFDRERAMQGLQFLALEPGQAVTVSAVAREERDRNVAHDVYELLDLLKVDGRKARKLKPAGAAIYSGVVVRLNYARHGEVNGVVLDTGDFVHTTPHGFIGLRLKSGSTVKASGMVRALQHGGGNVIDATRVNGKVIKRH